MAGLLLLVPALVTACSAPAAPSAPRTPAPVRTAWPGCAALDAFAASAEVPPDDVGGVPDGFAATTVVLCEEGERQDAAGDTVGVDLERTSPDVGPLLTYLAQPDEPPSDGACPAIGFVTPWLFLLDDAGRYVAPALPRDGCGLPLGGTQLHPLWELAGHTDRVVGEGEVVESAQARRAGCSMAWKDLLDDAATSSHRRPGGFAGDPFAGQPLRVCVFEVPTADRGTDSPAGELVSGRRVDERDRGEVVDALVAAPQVPAPCGTPGARFATLASTGGGPILYVELDGCRRVVSDGGSTPVVRASDALVALLGG